MVVFPTDPKVLIAPGQSTLIPEATYRRNQNPYTGRQVVEKTARERWVYELSWEWLKPAECDLLELYLQQMRAGEAATVPIYHAATQADIAIETTAALRAREATVDSGTPTAGLFFRVGDELKQIHAVDGATISIFPLVRSAWANQTVQTGSPSGVFELFDYTAAVQRRRGYGTLDITLVELIT